MTSHTPPKVAIIGSGPSGCYLAQSLLRAAPGSDITIFDRLAAPFGLVRYGVAADHQHTKAITRQFDRLFTTGVRFAGNIEIGRDLTLEQLTESFDVIVLASGLTADRQLGVPGGDLPGVFGAGAITRALNAHPSEHPHLPDFGTDVVIIGGGNVAIDILRFLVKDREGFAGSDVADEVLEAYLAQPAEQITLVSRSAAPQSKGDPQMLKELATLPRATYRTPDPIEPDGATDLDRTESGRVAAITEMVAAERPRAEGPEVTLRFGLTPLRVTGTDRVTGVEFAAGDDVITVPATSVITAIGFDAASDNALSELTRERSDSGRIAPGLYRTGWAKRGPQGAIPENRADAKAVAEEIAADLSSGTLPVSPSTLGYEGLPQSVRDRAISYDQWLVLDAEERAAAPDHRVRRKFANHDQMIEIARKASTN